LHAHKYVGKTNGRLLVSQTHGGLHEGFFEELGEEARDRTKTLFGTGEVYENSLTGERAVAPVEFYIRLTKYPQGVYSER
jgi:hypothetical protein